MFRGTMMRAEANTICRGVDLICIAQSVESESDKLKRGLSDVAELAGLESLQDQIEGLFADTGTS
jgi:hypothetical protein